MPTKIGWTGETWNPVHGCTQTSAGCLNCYAEKRAKRLAAMGIEGYDKKDPFAVQIMAYKLNQPYHWRKPRLVFVGSMGDMFHKDVSTSYIKQMFKVMEECPQHIFQVLTKRPARMAAHVGKRDWPENVWLGTSIEDCDTAWTRTAAMRGLHTSERIFFSYEPALEWVEWQDHLDGVNWFIIGCESGSQRRRFDNKWAMSAIEECRKRGIPVYLKQIIVDGKVSRDPSEWPKKLRVQEYPEAMMKVLEARV